MRIDFKPIVFYLKDSVDDGDTILADLVKIYKNACQNKKGISKQNQLSSTNWKTSEYQFWKGNKRRQNFTKK